MLFWNKICGPIAIFLLCGLSVSAQKSYVKYPAKEISQKPWGISSLSSVKLINKEELKPFKPLAIIPGNYYTQHFGLICKKELAIEKTTKIPFRFRLGSLQQCNYLEGKR